MTVNFDLVLEAVGAWGWFQKTRFVFLSLIGAFPPAFALGVSIFLVMPPKHQCALPMDLPPVLQNNSLEQLRALYVPEEIDQFAGYRGPHRCMIRDTETVLERLGGNLSSNNLIKCPNGWFYPPEEKWFVISEWNLVCDRNYIGSLILTITSLGGIIGTCVFSMLQDCIGRKPTLLIVTLHGIILSVLTTFMPDIFSFIAMATLRALAGIINFQIPYVMMLEYVSFDKNTFVINGMSIVFSISFATLALFGYLIHNWKHLILATSVPMLIFLAGFPWLEESPRWLLTKKKKERARSVVASIARSNGKELEPMRLVELMEASEEDDKWVPRAGIRDLFHSCPLIVLTMVMSYLWAINGMVYVGLTMNIQNMGGNPYLAFALIALVEIPAAGFNFIVEKVGRVWPACLTMLGSGLALLTASAVPQHIVWLPLVLVGISKFCITSSFIILYQIAGELFPTAVRGTGIGFATTINQILSLVTPFIIFSANFWRILPNLILGTLSVSGGLVCLFLPETLHKKLPDRIEDFGKNGVFGVKALRSNCSCFRGRKGSIASQKTPKRSGSHKSLYDNIVKT